MKKLVYFLKNYPFSCFCILCVWVLSLAPLHNLPLGNVRFIDKWTHFVMYGGTCGVIWTEYLLKHKKPNLKKLVLLAWLAPALMSGLLELLQEYCTGGRRGGEWLDFAANTTGATLSLCGGMLWVWFRARR